MKKVLETLGAGIFLVVVIVVSLLAVDALNNSDNPVTNVVLGGNNQANAETILGSASNLVSVPNALVFADATTTDAGGTVTDGGFEVNQLIRTDGIETVNLNISALGGTATSTLYVRQMVSQDGTNYFELATSTTNYINPGTGLRVTTSTPISGTPTGFIFIPGTVTSTISIPMQTSGHRFTRFLVFGDNLATDSADGIQAWITAIIVDKTK